MKIFQTDNSIHERVDSGGQVCISTFYTGKPFYKDDYASVSEPWKESDPTSIIDNGDVLVYDKLPIEVQLFKNEKIGYQVKCKKTGSVKRVTLLKIADMDVRNTDLGKTDLNDTYKFTPSFDVSELGVRLWKHVQKKGPSSFTWLIEDDGKSDFKFRNDPEAYDSYSKARVSIPTSVSKLDPTSCLFTEHLKNPLSASLGGITVDTDFVYEDGGYVYGTDNKSYAAARDTGDAYVSGSFIVGQSYVVGTKTIYRSFLKFDTSSVPSDRTILQANLSVTVEHDYGYDDFDVEVVKCDWSATEPIGSFVDAAYDLCLASTKDVTLFNTSGLFEDTEYSSPNLDTSWLDTASSTYYGLRSNRDFNNIPGYNYEYVVLYNGSTYGPKLVVYWLTGSEIIIL